MVCARYGRDARRIDVLTDLRKLTLGDDFDVPARPPGP